MLQGLLQHGDLPPTGGEISRDDDTSLRGGQSLIGYVETRQDFGEQHERARIFGMGIEMVTDIPLEAGQATRVPMAAGELHRQLGQRGVGGLVGRQGGIGGRWRGRGCKGVPTSGDDGDDSAE